jgi:hypothetical protein
MAQVHLLMTRVFFSLYFINICQICFQIKFMNKLDGAFIPQFRFIYLLKIINWNVGATYSLLHSFGQYKSTKTLARFVTWWCLTSTILNGKNYILWILYFLRLIFS